MKNTLYAIALATQVSGCHPPVTERISGRVDGVIFHAGETIPIGSIGLVERGDEGVSQVEIGLDTNRDGSHTPHRESSITLRLPQQISQSEQAWLRAPGCLRIIWSSQGDVSCVLSLSTSADARTFAMNHIGIMTPK